MYQLNSTSQTSQNITGPTILPVYQLMYDYTTTNGENGERIVFKKFTKFKLVQKYLNGWCWVESESKQSHWVPFIYLERVDKSTPVNNLPAALKTC